MSSTPTIDELRPSWSSYTTTTLTFIAVLSIYHYYTNFYSYFKKRGVKGPTPLPIVGNLLDIITGDRYTNERRWSEKYGNFFGMFLGASPRFVVNDAEVLRQVCIKDFGAMPNHNVHSSLDNFEKNALIYIQGDEWRRMRSMLSPTFTSGKIKRMYKLLDRCADDLVSIFSEQLDAARQKRLDKTIVNLKDIYSLYTMDGITSAAYSIKLERAGSANLKAAASRNEFVRLGLRIFEMNFLRELLFWIVPERLLAMFTFSVNHPGSKESLAERLLPIIEKRRVSQKKVDDYLQILLDARLDDEMDLNEMDDKENHHAGLTQESLKADKAKMVKQVTDSYANGANSSSKVKLTDFEVLASAVFFLAVGLETTANLLTNCTYSLAFHPEVQERLYETIKAVAKLNSQTGECSFDYEALTSCEYLDAVVSETLRILAPVVFFDRVLDQDYYVEKYGVQLRKGDKINLPYYSIMNNPEYWPDPLKFDPERFVGENKKKIVPGSYCPFGLGPRHCLGMRFSLTEAKLGLAKVLMKFKFSPVSGTKFPPEGKPHFNLITMKRPIVELSAR